MKKSKKILALVLSLLLVAGIVTVLSSCGNKNDNTFTVGFDAEFPPFGYLDEETGEYKGFDLDLATEVAKRNGWEIKLQPIDWNSKDAELSSGTIDCIWNGFTMNGREDLYTWTKPYVNNSQVVIVAADSGIKTLKDLAGKIVAVQTDSSAEGAFKDEEDHADLVELAATFKGIDSQKDYLSCYMNLKAKAVDAVAVDIGVAQNLLKDADGEYIILDEILYPEEYAVGFKLGNEELRDKVQATYDEMLEDGTVMKIAEKYKDSGFDASSIITK